MMYQLNKQVKNLALPSLHDPAREASMTQAKGLSNARTGVVITSVVITSVHTLQAMHLSNSTKSGLCPKGAKQPLGQGPRPEGRVTFLIASPFLKGRSKSATVAQAQQEWNVRLLRTYSGQGRTYLNPSVLSHIQMCGASLQAKGQVPLKVALPTVQTLLIRKLIASKKVNLANIIDKKDSLKEKPVQSLPFVSAKPLDSSLTCLNFGFLKRQSESLNTPEKTLVSSLNQTGDLKKTKFFINKIYKTTPKKTINFSENQEIHFALTSKEYKPSSKEQSKPYVLASNDLALQTHLILHKTGKVGELFNKVQASQLDRFSVYSSGSINTLFASGTSETISLPTKKVASTKEPFSTINKPGSRSIDTGSLERRQKAFKSSYSKLTEISLLTISLASATRIRQWAEKTLPNGKVVGEVINPETVHYKTLKPIKGGLFCERIFGPLKDHECACGKKFNIKNYLAKIMPNNMSESSQETTSTLFNASLKRYFCRICDVEYTYSIIRRTQLGYIQLASPTTHVWFVKGMPSYISILLDMKKKDLQNVIYNSQTLTLEHSFRGHKFLPTEPSSIFESWQKIMKKHYPDKYGRENNFSSSKTTTKQINKVLATLICKYLGASLFKKVIAASSQKEAAIDSNQKPEAQAPLKEKKLQKKSIKSSMVLSPNGDSMHVDQAFEHQLLQGTALEKEKYSTALLNKRFEFLNKKDQHFLYKQNKKTYYSRSNLVTSKPLTTNLFTASLNFHQGYFTKTSACFTKSSLLKQRISSTHKSESSSLVNFKRKQGIDLKPFISKGHEQATLKTFLQFQSFIKGLTPRKNVKHKSVPFTNQVGMSYSSKKLIIKQKPFKKRLSTKLVDMFTTSKSRFLLSQQKKLVKQKPGNFISTKKGWFNLIYSIFSSNVPAELILFKLQGEQKTLQLANNQFRTFNKSLTKNNGHKWLFKQKNKKGSYRGISSFSQTRSMLNQTFGKSSSCSKEQKYAKKHFKTTQNDLNLLIKLLNQSVFTLTIRTQKSKERRACNDWRSFLTFNTPILFYLKKSTCVASKLNSYNVDTKKKKTPTPMYLLFKAKTLLPIDNFRYNLWNSYRTFLSPDQELSKKATINIDPVQELRARIDAQLPQNQIKGQQTEFGYHLLTYSILKVWKILSKKTTCVNMSCLNNKTSNDKSSQIFTKNLLNLLFTFQSVDFVDCTNWRSFYVLFLKNEDMVNSDLRNNLLAIFSNNCCSFLPVNLVATQLQANLRRLKGKVEYPTLTFFENQTTKLALMFLLHLKNHIPESSLKNKTKDRCALGQQMTQKNGWGRAVITFLKSLDCAIKNKQSHLLTNVSSRKYLYQQAYTICFCNNWHSNDRHVTGSGQLEQGLREAMAKPPTHLRGGPTKPLKNILIRKLNACFLFNKALQLSVEGFSIKIHIANYMRLIKTKNATMYNLIKRCASATLLSSASYYEAWKESNERSELTMSSFFKKRTSSSCNKNNLLCYNYNLKGAKLVRLKTKKILSHYFFFLQKNHRTIADKLYYSLFTDFKILQEKSNNSIEYLFLLTTLKSTKNLFWHKFLIAPQGTSLFKKSLQGIRTPVITKSSFAMLTKPLALRSSNNFTLKQKHISTIINQSITSTDFSKSPQEISTLAILSYVTLRGNKGGMQRLHSDWSVRLGIALPYHSPPKNYWDSFYRKQKRVQPRKFSIWEITKQKVDSYSSPKPKVQSSGSEAEKSKILIANNIYCFSHRELWQQEKDWQDFAYYYYAPTNLTDIPIPLYKHRNSQGLFTADPDLFFSSNQNFGLAKKGLKKRVSSDQIPLDFYSSGMNINTAFSGAGLIQKLLNEFNYTELKKMDKQNRILLFEFNKQLKKLYHFSKSNVTNTSLRKMKKSKLPSAKSKSEYYKACHVRDVLIRRTKLTRKILTSLLPKTELLGETNNKEQNGLTSPSQGFTSSQEQGSRSPLKGQRQISKITALQSFNFSGMDTNGLNMILTVLPVLPPILRPVLKMSGQFTISDLNRLYQRIIYRNERLKKFLKDPALSSSFEMKYAQRLLQEAVDNLIQNGKSGVVPEKDARGRLLKSLSDILKGKQGRFRQYLLGKRVDYSGRSVIVVGPRLKLHECGIPKEMALILYSPFLIKRILNNKLADTYLSAKKLIQTNPLLVSQLLRDIMRDCPVLLNRAPTLHRLGFQAFQPKLVDGKAILLHPLVCPAFNADFDGDQMAVHVPITFEARAEAWKLMLARNNLLSPATGEPLILPSQDMVLGCYYLTTNCAEKASKYKKGSGMYFNSIDDVLKAYNQNLIHMHAVIWVNIKAHIENGHNIEQPIELRIPLTNFKINGEKGFACSLEQKATEKRNTKYPEHANNSISSVNLNYLEIYGKSHNYIFKSTDSTRKSKGSGDLKEPGFRITDAYCSLEQGIQTHQIIRTTPGKILFNLLIKKTIETRPGIFSKYSKNKTSKNTSLVTPSVQGSVIKKNLLNAFDLQIDNFITRKTVNPLKNDG